MRFNVFGMIVVIERQGVDWRAYFGGSNGIKRPADFIVPSDIEENDLVQYLGDLFHENARPGNDRVIRLDN